MSKRGRFVNWRGQLRQRSGAAVARWLTVVAVACLQLPVQRGLQPGKAVHEHEMSRLVRQDPDVPLGQGAHPEGEDGPRALVFTRGRWGCLASAWPEFAVASSKHSQAGDSETATMAARNCDTSSALQSRTGSCPS